MKRRDFIKKTCQSSLGIAVLSAGLAGCTTVYFAKTQMLKDQIVVPKSEFIFKKKEEIKTRNYVFIKSDNQKYPICLYKINDNYVAYWTECMHQGCEVEVQGNRFVCPCHGSTYDLEGRVTKGPAEKNLKSFKTSSDNENIYITLS
jgi:cytochrome b6-f complex iron-sulfur subunit